MVLNKRYKVFIYPLFIFMFMLLIVGTIDAESSFTFKKNSPVDLKIPVFDEDNIKASDDITCFISIRSPDSLLKVNDEPMDWNAGGIYNYTVSAENIFDVGEYPSSINCNDTAIHGFSTFNIKITPTGMNNTIGFYAIILLISFGIMLLGFYLSDAPIVILGTFGLYFVGIWTILYGIAGIQDLVTTWAIGIIFLGLAGYVSTKSAFELIEDY